MALTNSTRSIPKATYVRLQADSSDTGRGRSLLKSGFVRQLALQKGEVKAVLAAEIHQEPRLAKKRKVNATPIDVAHHDQAGFSELLSKFEGTPAPSQLPSPAEFANVLSDQLVAFGKGLVKLRQMKVARASLKTDEKQLETQAASLKRIENGALDLDVNDLGNLLNLANIAVAGTNAFTANTGISPVGLLNLERLEMTPAGIEQGELLATIPLAPKEKTSVVQQEWSVVSQEFTSIVTDELENFSEKGVTENTELAQATTNQNAHSNQFNVTASASGGCGFVSGSVSTNFGSQDQGSQSATDSRKHAQTTTQKASSRVKQSRKVTISSSTVSGASESTTRALENPSHTEPMRIDYFSMMRRWQVGLYRYGLRLTYDITVPEPGAAMRAAYMELAELTEKSGEGFVFDLPYDKIDENSYPGYSVQYGAELPAPPPTEWTTMVIGGPVEHAGIQGDALVGANLLTFEVTDGYEIDHVTLDTELNNWNGVGAANGRRFDVLGSSTDTWSYFDPSDRRQKGHFDPLLDYKGNPFMQGARGSQSISYMTGNFNIGIAIFTLTLHRTKENWEGWVLSVWNALYNAAQTSFYTNQSKVQAQITDLQNKINDVDTLTLRREENDEIMKCALRWILGTRFEFVPDSVVTLFESTAMTSNGASNDSKYGVSFTGSSLNTPDFGNWAIAYQYEAIVSFINEAIDWDNVIYFLYSYFWDVPLAWDFVRGIQHPDRTRQAFLRAGSARIVLTLRPGYETAWTWFAENFSLNTPESPPDGYPYMTIAQQVRDYDNTYYPGIPPANPSGGSGGGAVDDGTPAAGTTCSALIHPGATSTTNVKIPVADSTGFVAGATAIIDSWDAVADDGVSKIQESSTIVAVPDKTHIVVVGLVRAHNGTKTQGGFPVLQAGVKGVLIAEWVEYTPSKGTLIGVNSDLGSMQ